MRLSHAARDNIVGVVVLVILVVALGLSATYGYRSRLVPITVASACVLLQALQLVLQNRQRLFGRLAVRAEIEPVSPFETELPKGSLRALAATERDGVASGAADEAVAVGQSFAGGSVLSAVLTVTAYAALIVLIGILPAVFLFVLLFLRVHSGLPLHRALLGAISTLAVTYLLFSVTLGVPMNSGFLVSTAARLFE